MTRLLRILAVLLMASVVTGCATQSPYGRNPPPGAVHDPYERTNRGIHQFNLGVDRSLFRPAAKSYVAIVPPSMVTSFSMFADNFSEPGNVVNAMLQGNLKRAGTATARFLINSTIGFAGLADPATEFGIPADHTDFGETLHVWGVGEGAYVELPVFGPSTQRDSVGLVVDFFTNPLSYARNSGVDNVGPYAEVVQRLGERGTYSDTVDAILYESADGYAQLRTIYLQNRRYQLAGESGRDFADPYEDEFSLDPYEDPYE